MFLLLCFNSEHHRFVILVFASKLFSIVMWYVSGCHEEATTLW